MKPGFNWEVKEKDVCAYLYEYCSHLDLQEFKNVDDSLWVDLDLFASPEKCAYFYSFGFSVDFFYDLFRYLDFKADVSRMSIPNHHNPFFWWKSELSLAGNFS